LVGVIDKDKANRIRSTIQNVFDKAGFYENEFRMAITRLRQVENENAALKNGLSLDVAPKIDKGGS